MELSDLSDENGFTINGINPFDQSGLSVSSAGDFNGDGFDDLVISAHEADPEGRSGAGSSYVVFGTDGSIQHPFNLSSLGCQNGFVIKGVKDRRGGRGVV